MLVTELPAFLFAVEQAKDVLFSHFKVEALDGLGLFLSVLGPCVLRDKRTRFQQFAELAQARQVFRNAVDAEILHEFLRRHVGVRGYASYLKPKEDLVLSSLTASATNGFAEVIIGGTVVIPMAVLIAGANIEECAKLGTFGLGFQTMPYVFGTLPFGGFLQTVWFAMLFFAGITSAISIIQPLISFCEGRRS